MLGDKLRFRFAKTGTLRLLSHHDLMRCLERMLRRAALPFKSTAGFHPTPRAVFALSLPLGVVGRAEVVELELTRPCDAGETLAALAAQAPTGLEFTGVSVVPMKATAIPRRVVYHLPLPADRVDETRERANALMAQDKVWVDRVRPSPRRLNIRPYFRSLSAASGGREPTVGIGLGEHRGVSATCDSTTRRPDGSTLARAINTGLTPPARQDHLLMDLWVTATGTARPGEVIDRLGLTGLMAAGAVLERTELELHDEATDPADHPPAGPAEALPLDPAAVAALLDREDDASQPVGSAWGASPGGPVVE